MRYGFLFLILFVVTSAMMALNVYWALAHGTAFNWAAAVFIAPMVVFQLALLLRSMDR
jgi:hypothetical protein